MSDLTDTYRTAQVTSSSPAAQVVLLYEGAIRFATLSVTRLDAGDLEGSHKASLRAQAILSALRETLDLSAGDVARNLDGIYDFMIRKLVAGNIDKNPTPTREVTDLLRELLTAWRAATCAPQTAPASRPAPPEPTGYRFGVIGAA